MAQRVKIELVSDVSGEEIQDGKGETVSFGLDGTTYELDVTDKEAAALRKSLDKYVSVARKVGRKTGRAGARTQVGPSAKEVREWAKSNGFTVPERGRIPAEVREAFENRSN